MRLPRIMDLGAAAPLWSELSGARGAALELDASDVERLGGLCTQVLIAAAAAWRAVGKEFRVVNPSEPFTEALSIMGASGFLAPERA